MGDLPAVTVDELLMGTLSDAPDQPPKLTLVRERGLSIDLEVSTTADANRILEALGLGSSHSVARASGLPWPPILSYLPALLYLLLGTWIGIVPGALGILAAWLLKKLLERRIDVGSDGLAFRGLRAARFVSFADVVAITSREGIAPRFRVELRDGSHLQMFLRDSKALAELLAAVNNALDAYRAAHGTDGSGALHRRGRAMADWVADLRRVGSGASADHRTAPVERETLLRIATDANEDPSERAAAAIALSSTPNAQDREQVLELSRTTARPRLRVLMQQASAGVSDEMLAAALESVAEEEASIHAKS